MEEIERLADAGEHAEGKDIDLHQAKFIDIVLVPLDEGAVVHRGIADGDKLIQPVTRQHETADMLGEMARKAHQPVGEAQGAMQHWIVRIEPRLT